MSNAPVTWSQVARRPRWIGAFFVAMTVAAVCAFLAQWQAERSFEQAVTDTQQTVSRPIDSLLTAGEAAPTGAVGSLVTAELMPDFQNTFIVANRLQRDGAKGYWLISPARNALGNRLFVTLGFSAELAAAKQSQLDLSNSVQVQAFMTYEGLLMPSEAPVMSDPQAGAVLESLSLAQLINLLPNNSEAAQPKTYPLFMLLTKPNPSAPGLSAITIEPASSEVQLNLLSAFYALEWTIFCGFAFFLWWRLVRDQQALENGQLEPVKR